MEYETSPTIRYDGTGEASNEGDNHSEKTGSTASEGSEGFVKVEEVMEDTSESHATPASSNTPAASSATPEEGKKPAEIELLQGLDPRETQPPDAVPTEGGSVGDKPQEAPEPLESDDKAPLTAEEPRPSMLETFNVSSLLSCSVGGVLDLLYWKDIKASAVTFGLSLLVLLSLCCCSIISVFSYLILSLLTVTISFRLYKFVVQTLNGTQQPNPFQSLLDADMTLSPEQVHKYTDAVLSRLNGLIVTTRDLVLVKSLGASLKFGVLTWLMTYVGACFNGLTLLIIADVLAFLMPPVYQKYQQPIDTYYELVTSKTNHVVTMVRSYIPGAKPKSE